MFKRWMLYQTSIAQSLSRSQDYRVFRHLRTQASVSAE